MTLYHGFRTVDGTACVVIEGPGTTIRPLPRRLDLACHSPDGFEWGSTSCRGDKTLKSFSTSSFQDQDRSALHVDRSLGKPNINAPALISKDHAIASTAKGYSSPPDTNDGKEDVQGVNEPVQERKSEKRDSDSNKILEADAIAADMTSAQRPSNSITRMDANQTSVVENSTTKKSANIPNDSNCCAPTAISKNTTQTFGENDGPAQLALALLADVLSDDARALRLHQRFKFQVIGKLDRLHEWRMTDADVRFWSTVQQEQEAAAK